MIASAGMIETDSRLDRLEAQYPPQAQFVT